MKWMTPDERAEWHDTLDDANAHPGTTGERAEKLLSILAEKAMLGVGWIDETLKHLALHGAQRELKRRHKVASTVLVPFDTAVAIRSMRVGTRSNRSDGSSGFQQRLFEEMSWGEVREHAAMLQGQLRQLGMTISLDRRLLALEERYPDTVGPADACARLGVTVQQFLEQGEAA